METEFSERMSQVLIVNARAGAIEKGDDETGGSALQQKLAQAGIDVELLEVPGEKIKEAATQAAQKGATLIIAAGGDGTVSATACGILEWKRDVPLGVLPLGTLNHFAKDLGIPTDLDAAIELLSTGKQGKVDAAEVNGIGFLNNSSVGIYPKSVEEREERRLTFRSGKWPAMFSALISVFKRLPLYRVTVTSDEKRISSVSPFIFVGNNRYDVDLFSLGSRARVNEGVLSLYMAKTASRSALVKHAALALIGRLDQARDFESVTSTEIEISARRAELTVSLDGEVRKLQSPLKYRILPQALTVVLPNKG